MSYQDSINAVRMVRLLDTADEIIDDLKEEMVGASVTGVTIIAEPNPKMEGHPKQNVLIKLSSIRFDNGMTLYPYTTLDIVEG